jgi:hypothetical protein
MPGINIYPEMFFFPWLVAKGLVPYRDFFDHHGFLLYYLLSPLSLDKSLLLIKLFYLSIQVINFYLFFLIIKKFSSKKVIFISSIIFVFLNFFVNENNFWFETVIAFFYLLVIWLLQQSSKRRFFIIGLLIGAASLIKPTAGLVLPGLLLIYRQRKLLFGFLSVWFLCLLYFFSQGALGQLWQCLFVFNSKLPSYVAGTYLLQDKKFLLANIALLFLSFSVIRQKLFSYFYLTLLLFLAVAVLFVYPSYGRAHLAVLAVLLPIFFAKACSLNRFYFSLALTVYFVYLSILTYGHWHNLLKRQEYLDNPEIVKTLKQINKPANSDRLIYVANNQVEYYYLKDQLPIDRFPIYFSGWTAKFYPNQRAGTLKKINSNKRYLIIK